MKTIAEAISDYGESTITTDKGTPVYFQGEVTEIVEMYAKELLNHLMENSYQYIYIDDGEGKEPDEAVFSYKKMQELRDSLK